MSNDLNPYSAPTAPAEVMAEENAPGRWDKLSLISWPVILAVNLIVPLLLGLMVTEDHGRVGMFLAVGVFLAAGWALCYYLPHFARRFILGGLFTALSQLFPILQFLSGIIALAIADGLGVEIDHSPGDGPVEQLTSEFGGFLVTLLVGLMISAVAAGIGLLLALVLPKRWFQPDAGQSLRSSEFI